MGKRIRTSNGIIDTDIVGNLSYIPLTSNGISIIPHTTPHMDIAMGAYMDDELDTDEEDPEQPGSPKSSSIDSTPSSGKNSIMQTSTSAGEPDDPSSSAQGAAAGRVNPAVNSDATVTMEKALPSMRHPCTPMRLQWMMQTMQHHSNLVYQPRGPIRMGIRSLELQRLREQRQPDGLSTAFRRS